MKTAKEARKRIEQIAQNEVEVNIVRMPPLNIRNIIKRVFLVNGTHSDFIDICKGTTGIMYKYHGEIILDDANTIKSIVDVLKAKG